MRRRKDIDTILEHEEARLDQIRQLCETAARAEEDLPQLRLAVKSFFENLRSVLDYLAYEIRESCCPPLESKDRTRFGFPIMDSESKFKQKASAAFPELEQNHPEVYSYLESVQPYRSDYATWLAHFRDLNNKNKHEKLVTHQRLQAVTGSPEEKELGPVVFLIKGGVDEDYRDATWASLKFEDGGKNVLLLLMQSLSGVREIDYELTFLLGAIRSNHPTPSLQRTPELPS